LDKGKYYCQNDCKILENDCVNCGKSGGVGTGVSALPHVTLKNVMNPNSGKIDWPLNGDMELKLSYAKNDQSTPALSFVKVDKTTNSNNLKLSTSTIVTDLACNAASSNDSQYWLDFSSISSSEFNSDRRFPYPVSGEDDVIKELHNNYVITPPVLNNKQFRVVVKWGEENKNVEFEGVVHNNGFTLAGAEWHPLHYSSASGNLCKDSDIDKCENLYNGVYVHERSFLNKENFQATTIDTSKWSYKTNYAFTVSQYSNKDPETSIPSIKPYVNSDLIVEVYEFRENKPINTIYKPTQIFTIKTASNKNADNSAKYWHVFDLVYNSELDNFSVVEVNKITNDDQKIKEELPDSTYVPNGYLELVESDVITNGVITSSEPYSLLIYQTDTNFTYFTYPNDDTLYSTLSVYGFDNKKSNYSCPTLFSKDQNIIDCRQTFLGDSSNYHEIYELSTTIENTDAPNYVDSNYIYFDRLKENVPYSYVSYVEDYSYEPGDDVYNTGGIVTWKSVIDNGNMENRRLSFNIYYADVNGNFRSITSTSDNFVLNQNTYKNVVKDNKYWHLFNVFKKNNDLYFQIKNNFVNEKPSVL